MRRQFTTHTHMGAPMTAEPTLFDEKVVVNGRGYYGIVRTEYCDGEPWSEEGRFKMEGRFGLVYGMDVRPGDRFLPCCSNHVDRDLHLPVIKTNSRTEGGMRIIDQSQGTDNTIAALHVRDGGAYQNTHFWVLIDHSLYYKN